MNAQSALLTLTAVVLVLLLWQLRWVLLVLFGAVVKAVALDVNGGPDVPAEPWCSAGTTWRIAGAAVGGGSSGGDGAGRGQENHGPLELTESVNRRTASRWCSAPGRLHHGGALLISPLR